MSLPPLVAPDASSPEAPFDGAALLAALPWGVLVLDAAGVIQGVNPAAARWCDAPPDALLGKPLAEVALPAALGAGLRQLLQAAPVVPADIWLPHAQQWVSLRPGPAPAGQHWVFWEDATTRHRAEATQQRSTQLLLDLEAVAHTGSYEADLATGSIYFSDGLYRLFGEAPQAFEVTLDVIDARSHPADAATVRQVLDAAVAARQPYTYRRRIRRPDGTWRTLEAHGEVRCDAAGTPVQLRGLVQDITERVQAEQALHQSHQLLQRTIDSSLDLVQVFEAVRDEQGAVVDFRWVLNNAAAEQVFGNVIGQRLLQRNPGVAAEGIFHTFRQVLETGVPSQDERHYQHEQSDGWFYQSTVRLGDGVATTTRNITERKQAEQEIRETKELLRATLDSAPYVVQAFRAVRDAGGQITDFTWILTNQAGRQQSGEFVTGKSLLLENPGVVESGLFEKFVRVTETGVPIDHEQYYAHEQFQGWFHQTLVKLGDGFVMNTVDITERKQAHAEVLRLKDEMTRQVTDKYHALFHRMDQGYCIIQMLYDAAGQPVDWRYLEVNPAFEKHNGLRNALGKTIRELAPDIEQKWIDIYGHVAATGESRRFEEDSEALHRAFDLYAFRVGEPGAGLVAVLFTNVTERRRAETALRESEAQLARFNTELEERVARRTQQLQESRDLLQSVFDTTLIAMVALEAVRDAAGQVQDFRVKLISRDLLRETGRPDLAGKLFMQECPIMRATGVFEAAVRALVTGQPQSLEYCYAQEGIQQWFASQFVKLGDGVVATTLNITERKNAEQERLNSLYLLNQAEAVAGLGSWSYDLATGTMRWSDGMYHLFGLPVGSSVEPNRYLDAVLDEDRPRAEQLVQRLTRGQGFEETLRLRVGGAVKIVRMKAVVFASDQGQPERVLGVDLDVSQRHHLEQENLRLRLRQQQALFEAVQAAQEAERRRIAEGLHNGIGQLLYATKLRLDRLHTPLLSMPPALAAARAEADQLLADAIRQTRALSHELVPMVLREFGLAAALQDIGQKMSTPQLRLHSHVELDEEASPLPPSLQMALYRMAQELAQNMVKHAHGATTASLELETTPGWVMLRAEDNGPGFPATPAEPPGLGLRSIRDRVALLGGQVEMGSSPGGGAYVRIRIPLAHAPAL